MTSVKYDLGKSEHVHAASNLKLKSQCSIKLYSSLGCIFPFSDLLQELDSLISSDIWVAQENGLQISVKIITDDLVSQDFDRNIFVDGLRTLICGAELWNQLDFKASVVAPGELLLSEDFRVSLSSRSAPRGQPLGIPLACLEHIQMTFIFSCSISPCIYKKHKVGPSYEGCAPILLKDFVSTKHLDPPDRVQPQLLDAMLLPPYDISQHRLLLQQPIDAEDEEKPIRGNYFTLVPSLPVRERLFNFTSRNTAMELPLDKPATKRSMLADFQGGDKIAFADLTKLLDAGLRTMICGDRIGRSAGVNLSSAHPRANLAKISPALFRPGYLSAVWEHDRLFDTIAHRTIMIHIHTKCASLRSKIGSLINFAPNEYVDPDGLTACAPQDAIANAIRARLWKSVVSKLLHSSEAAILKPLDWTNDSFPRILNAEAMLDQGSPPNLEDSEHSASPPLDGVDEYLLFENDEEKSETISGKEILFEESDLNHESEALDDILFENDGVALTDFGDDNEELLWREENEPRYIFSSDKKELLEAFNEELLDRGDPLESLQQDSLGENRNLLLEDFLLSYQHENSTYSEQHAWFDEMLISS